MPATAAAAGRPTAGARVLATTAVRAATATRVRRRRPEAPPAVSAGAAARVRGAGVDDVAGARSTPARRDLSPLDLERCERPDAAAERGMSTGLPHCRMARR